MSNINDPMDDAWLAEQFRRAAMLAKVDDCSSDEAIMRRLLRGFANRVLMSHGRNEEACKAALAIEFTDKATS